MLLAKLCFVAILSESFPYLCILLVKMENFHQNNDARIESFSVQNQNFQIVQLESCGSPVHCQFGIIQVVPIMPVVLDHCLIFPISSHFEKMKRTSSTSINVINLEHLRCEVDSCVCQFELVLSLSIVVM